MLYLIAYIHLLQAPVSPAAHHTQAQYVPASQATNRAISPPLDGRVGYQGLSHTFLSPAGCVSTWQIIPPGLLSAGTTQSTIDFSLRSGGHVVWGWRAHCPYPMHPIQGTYWAQNALQHTMSELSQTYPPLAQRPFPQVRNLPKHSPPMIQRGKEVCHT